MMAAYSAIRVDEMLALIVVLGALALGLQCLVGAIETRVASRWGLSKAPSATG